MTASESRLLSAQRRLAGAVPLDVAGVWALAALAGWIALEWGAGAPRFLLGSALLFLLPGYLVVAVLFPHRESAAHAAPSILAPGDRIGLRERLALSFGLSVAVLPLLALALVLSPFPLRAPWFVAEWLGFVALAGVVAAFRRRRLAPEDRYLLPIADWVAETRHALGAGSRRDRILNAALLASVLLALGTGGLAIAAPLDGEQFTSLAVLTEDGENLTAGNYPAQLEAGESADLVTAVENHEGSEQEYTVVVVAERPASSERGRATEELLRYEGIADPGETWTNDHEVEPTLVGPNVRINYYLYRGDPPEDVGTVSAYRHAYLWVSVGGE